MTLLAGHLEQSFDGFGQVHRLGRPVGSGGAVIAGVENLASRTAAGFNHVIVGSLRLRFLAAGGLGSKDERGAGPLRLARGPSLTSAAVLLCSDTQFAFLQWQNLAIDLGYPLDYVRLHRLAFETIPFA
jgi:hypothetical protein